MNTRKMFHPLRGVEKNFQLLLLKTCMVSSFNGYGYATYGYGLRGILSVQYACLHKLTQDRARARAPRVQR